MLPQSTRWGIKVALVYLAPPFFNTLSLPTNMPPQPYRPGDIVRILASVNKTLRGFFFDNSHLSTISGVTEPHESKIPPLNRGKFKGYPVRPGVILDVHPDYATVAMFTSLHVEAPSDVKGLLRHVVAAIHPANHKRDAAASGWLHTLAVHPTWHTSGGAKHTLCLCIRHQVPINGLKPWSWKEELASVEEDPKMYGADFRALQQLCERNERLRGLFVSEMRWLFEDDDVVKRFNRVHKGA